MKKEWTNQDVARLTYLVDKLGHKDGITAFAKETDRTFDSVRMKFSRLNKERIVLDAENKAYNENNAVEHKTKIGFFKRLINKISTWFK